MDRPPNDIAESEIEKKEKRTSSGSINGLRKAVCPWSSSWCLFFLSVGFLSAGSSRFLVVVVSVTPQTFDFEMVQKLKVKILIVRKTFRSSRVPQSLLCWWHFPNKIQHQVTIRAFSGCTASPLVYFMRYLEVIKRMVNSFLKVWTPSSLFLRWVSFFFFFFFITFLKNILKWVAMCRSPLTLKLEICVKGTVFGNLRHLFRNWIGIRRGFCAD